MDNNELKLILLHRSYYVEVDSNAIVLHKSIGIIIDSDEKWNYSLFPYYNNTKFLFGQILCILLTK